MNLTDWQTPAALLVVAVTAMVFLRRALRRPAKTKGCPSCSCGGKNP